MIRIVSTEVWLRAAEGTTQPAAWRITCHTLHSSLIFPFLKRKIVIPGTRSDAHIRKSFPFLLGRSNVFRKRRIVIAGMGYEVFGVRLRVSLPVSFIEHRLENASCDGLVLLLFVCCLCQGGRTNQKATRLTDRFCVVLILLSSVKCPTGAFRVKLPPAASNLLTSRQWLPLVKPRETFVARANRRYSPAETIAGSKSSAWRSAAVCPRRAAS